MKRALVCGFVALLLIPAAGCKGNDPESLIKQQIADMNALADALEKKESPEKLKAAAEKLKATSEKFKNLKLPEDQSKKLLEKYGGELIGAAFKLAAAEGKNPEGAKAVEDIVKGAMMD
jgi:hypothetical protein